MADVILQSLEFTLCSLYRRAILLRPTRAKFHRNRKTGCWVIAKKRFLICRPSVILNLKKIIYGHVTVVEFQIWCCVTHFINIAYFYRAVLRIGAIIRAMHSIARTMLSQDVSPSVCPFVCLSHAGILSKQLNISPDFFSESGRHTIIVIIVEYKLI